jgi:GAF domain-containing protein
MPQREDAFGMMEHKLADEELRARIRQLRAVAELGLLALESKDLSSLLEEAVRLVAGALLVEYCQVLKLLPDGERLLLCSGIGWKKGVVGRASVDARVDSHAGYTLVSKKPVIVEDFRTETRFDIPPLLRHHGVVSGFSTAIYASGRVVGVLGAYTTGRRSFTEDEARFLQDVARVLGMVIEHNLAEQHARHTLKEWTEQAVAAEHRFTFLSEVNALLSTSVDHSTALTVAARLAVPAIADWCFVDLIEAGGNIYRFVVAHADPEKETLAQELRFRYPLDPRVPHGTSKVIKTGRSELIQEVDETVLVNITQDTRHQEILRYLGSKSYICVPLQIRGQLLGAIGLVSAESGRRYGQEDLTLAEGLARCLALAIYEAQHHVSEVELARELIQLAKKDQRVVSPANRRAAPALTPRQLEILRLLSRGVSAKGIGEELHLSQATIRNHINALLRAFNAHSQLEALARAREVGILAE